MSTAAPPAKNPESLFMALEALDLEARAAERLGMTVERYRELLDDEPE